jgi:phosphate acetyltransferase
MKIFDDLIDRARAAPKRIVLAEGLDPRIVAGAVCAQQSGIAEITLLAPLEEARLLTRAAGDGDDHIQIIDPKQTERQGTYANIFHKLRQHKGIDLSAARLAIRDPLIFANLMVYAGDAAGSVAGAVHTTPDVVRSALQVIGTDDRYSMVSSFFIMLMYEDFHEMKGGLVFADCGLVVDPDEDQLAVIASAAADSAATLLGLDPRVAMLSFSTRGSADHPHVDKVENATRKLKDLRPELPIEGAVQFDAGFVPEIALMKAPGSDVAGRANVLIFPDLNAGNIGYKIAEQLGQLKAVGPILQGLAKPANDLSRGCDADAVYRMIAVTVVQAQSAEEPPETDTKSGQ